MPTNNTGVGERDGTNRSFSQAGSVLAAAWSEFVSRALEMGGKRAVEAALQALAPGQGGGAGAGAIEALVERYRQVLGSMAERAPAVGRYLAGLVKPGAPGGSRLLYRIPKQRASVMDAYRAQASDPHRVRVWLGEATVQALTNEVQEALQIGQADLSAALQEVSRVVEGDSVPDLARVLDELKYDFRRDGPQALPGIRARLRPLLDEKLDTRYKLMDLVTQVLGERAIRVILQQQALARYGQALHSGQPPIPPTVVGMLRDCHACVGLELSERVSFIIRRNSGWVFDHEYDTVYEVKYFDEHFDVYGPQEGRRYTVGPSDAPSGLLLPYRITDASEGIVVWAVDKRIVNEDLQVRGQDTDARANPTNLEAWDIGDGKTPVVLGVVDHREGDLKAHREMVLCAVVAPKDQPLAVGIWPMCEAPVTTPLVKQASIQIWGYDKVLSSITTRHTGRRAIFELTGESGGKLLTLTLPRGGESMSPMIPVLSYTLKRATPYSPRALHRTLITRSGRGEQLRGGGAGVELEVDPHGLTMTGTGPASALCQMLQRLGLVDGSGQLACPPLFTAWTEELSAEVGGPSLVVTAAESA